MTCLLFKWLLISMLGVSAGSRQAHPIYVSVTEIEHNAKEKTLEISCKIFTDDFEKTLRAAYNTHVDLSDEKIKSAMDKLVNDYVTKHLKIAVNGKPVTLSYLGFEKVEEGIYSYYRVDNISTLKKLTVTDDILFEFSDQQLNIIHAIENGVRQSTKLEQPDSVAEILF